MTQEERDNLFVDCYEKFNRYVNNYCYRFVPDNEDRTDLVHDTFMKVYNNLHQFEGRGAKISTWIFAIARNTCFNYMRTEAYKSKSRTIHIDKTDLRSSHPDPEQLAIRNQGSERLHKSMERLDGLQKTDIEYLMQGYRVNDISNMTQRTPRAVRKSLTRSKITLKRFLRNKV